MADQAKEVSASAEKAQDAPADTKVEDANSGAAKTEEKSNGKLGNGWKSQSRHLVIMTCEGNSIIGQDTQAIMARPVFSY